jgi:hypothetical protein
MINPIHVCISSSLPSFLPPFFRLPICPKYKDQTINSRYALKFLPFIFLANIRIPAVKCRDPWSDESPWRRKRRYTKTL